MCTYRQSIRFDWQKTILRADALYVVRVGAEHSIGPPHHANKHSLGCCRHSRPDTIEEGGGGEGVAEGIMSEGSTGASRGVDGNQKSVNFAGGRALFGVFGPAAMHDGEKNGRKGGSTRR
jgi:hypothetical protein